MSFDARCPRHPEAVADGACERCGTFMCRSCSNRGVSKRCPGCSPHYGASELAERRRTSVRRATAVRCDACGFESPLFLVARAPSVTVFVSLTLLSLLSCGGPALLALPFLLAPSHPACFSCGRDDELEPCAHDVARPEGWSLRVSGERRRQAVSSVMVLFPALLAGALGWYFNRHLSRG